MLFVKPNETPSSQLRGDHIAAALGCECRVNDIDGIYDEDIVFVKQADSDLVLDAKSRGCRVIYDVLDWLCYVPRNGARMQDWYEHADVVIVPNRFCMEGYKKLFPNATFVLIPHQWDHRIVGYAAQDEFRPGYVGKHFNLRIPLPVGMVTEFEDMIREMPRFNCHLSLVATDLLWRWKPATKVAAAAAVGANILVQPDPSAKELLPKEYPYWIDKDPRKTLEYARETFGTSTWKLGLEMMAQVRERTSLKAVAELYRTI